MGLRLIRPPSQSASFLSACLKGPGSLGCANQLHGVGDGHVARGEVAVLVIISDLKPGDDIRLLARQILHSSHVVHVVLPLTGLSQIVTANLSLPDLIFPIKSSREAELVPRTKEEAPQRPLKRWMTYSPRSTPSTGLAHPHAQTSRHMGHPLTAASYPALLGTACLGEI